METITIPKTTSQLRNMLLQVVAAPNSPWRVIVKAGELIAVDAEFDDWFLNVAKTRLSEQEIEGCLAISDEVTDEVEKVWREQASRPDMPGMYDALSCALALLRNKMASVLR